MIAMIAMRLHLAARRGHVLWGDKVVWASTQMRRDGPECDRPCGSRTGAAVLLAAVCQRLQASQQALDLELTLESSLAAGRRVQW